LDKAGPAEVVPKGGGNKKGSDASTKGSAKDTDKDKKSNQKGDTSGTETDENRTTMQTKIALIFCDRDQYLEGRGKKIGTTPSEIDDAKDEQCLCGWKLSTDDEKTLYGLGSDFSNLQEDGAMNLFSLLEAKAKRREQAKSREKSAESAGVGETEGVTEGVTASGRGDQNGPEDAKKSKPDPFANQSGPSRQARLLEKELEKQKLLDKLCHANNALPMSARGVGRFLDAKAAIGGTEGGAEDGDDVEKPPVLAAANSRRGSQMGDRRENADGFDGSEAQGGRQRQIFILNLEVEEPDWTGPTHPVNQWIMKFDAREVRGTSGERGNDY